jgi:hypothetical protein
MLSPSQRSQEAEQNPEPEEEEEAGEQRFIVDKDVADARVDDVFNNIQDAILAAELLYRENQESSDAAKRESEIKIKVASHLYEESLHISVPGLVLEPKEKGGEVTL